MIWDNKCVAYPPLPTTLVREGGHFISEGFHNDPHRIPLNLLNNAASGAANGYPDIIGGTPVTETTTNTFRKYYIRNAMLAAVTPGMSFVRGPEALKQFDIESGSLSEWDGNEWKMVRRDQFCEVTGPGGIMGNTNPETDPIWATGWDHRSLLLGVRHQGNWTFFRMPKASHSYDGAHGWNTEWPRIRDVGTSENPDYLMTMHGMFWRFPGNFTPGSAAGIRPRSAYLKIIGDFARWNDQIVFGCDDAAQKEFLNLRSAKGGIEGAGQSNSNLWFTCFDTPDLLGPATASGAVWLNDDVAANTPSEPFLFAGWEKRMAWIHNAGNADAEFAFEVDKNSKSRRTFRSVPFWVLR